VREWVYNRAMIGLLSGRIRRLAVGTAVLTLGYVIVWGATQFGTTAAMAAADPGHTARSVRAWSPYPFVVKVECLPRGGPGFTASYAWCAGPVVELHREFAPTPSPFIYTLF
jgi:hypothetical protein